MAKDKGSKWKVTYPNTSKKKGVYTIIADTAKKAWALSRRPYLSDHGHKMMPHSLHPISISKVEEGQEYKNLAHVIRDVHLDEARRKGFDLGKHLKALGFIASETHANPNVVSTYYPDQVSDELDKLQAAKKLLSRPRISVLKRRESVSELEEEYLEERRRGPTKPMTREKQRVGAKRAATMKSVRPRKVKRKKGMPFITELSMQEYIHNFLESKKKLAEVVAVDTPPNRPVTKPVPDKKSGGVIMKVFARAGRRHEIDTTAANVRVPKKFNGYRGYVDHYTGITFNN